MRELIKNIKNIGINGYVYSPKLISCKRSKCLIKIHTQKDIKNKKQSNKRTNHFENDLGAYLPLNIANASCFIILFILLILPILNILFVFFLAD